MPKKPQPLKRILPTEKELKEAAKPIRGQTQFAATLDDASFGKKENDLNELLEKLECLKDGIYDVTGIPVLEVLEGGKKWTEKTMDVEDTWANEKEIRKFLEDNPKAMMALTYEVDIQLLIAQKPKELKEPETGYIGQGAAAILNVPENVKSILILAEND